MTLIFVDCEGHGPAPGRSVEERFWEKVDKSGDCWLWLGAITGAGYAEININGRPVLGHRWSYEQVYGPIPAGHQLDHLCRNRACVRPQHLEAVTCRINLLRGKTITAAHAAKTSCPSGHPYSPRNTYRTPKGFRQCRTCRAKHVRSRKVAGKR